MLRQHVADGRDLNGLGPGGPELLLCGLGVLVVSLQLAHGERDRDAPDHVVAHPGDRLVQIVDRGVRAADLGGVRKLQEPGGERGLGAQNAHDVGDVVVVGLERELNADHGIGERR